MGERQINFCVNVAVKRMQTDERQVTARAFQIMRFGNTRHGVRGNQFNRNVKLRTREIIHPQNSDAAHFHQTGKARGRLGIEGVFMRDQTHAVIGDKARGVAHNQTIGQARLACPRPAREQHPAGWQ